MSSEIPLRDMGLGALFDRLAARVARSIANVLGFDGSGVSEGPAATFATALGRALGSGDSAARQATLAPLIEAAAQRYGVPVDLVNAVIRVESNFRPDAVSPAGALGLMQLMPATARGLGVQDPLDPVQNIDGGVRHLSKLLAGFQNVPLALAAYNAGSYAVNKHRGIPPYAETQAYVKRVMAIYGGSIDREG
jgi:soluble lytic murein transglycosylase-like protein